tara:strand:+ start:1556 stop:1723 length:168 start_codon:yes stop_codon:yes gene_type:complete
MKRSELIAKLMENPEGDPEVTVFEDGDGTSLNILSLTDERECSEDRKDNINIFTE